MTRTPPAAKPPQRRRVLVVVLVFGTLIFGLTGFGVVRYGLYRLENRDLRQEGFRLVKEGQAEEAIPVLQEYVRRRPKDAEARRELARATLARPGAGADDGFAALALLDSVLA